jgi:hypothetical protein
MYLDGLTLYFRFLHIQDHHRHPYLVVSIPFVKVYEEPEAFTSALFLWVNSYLFEFWFSLS